MTWPLAEGSNVAAQLDLIAPDRSAQITLRRNDDHHEPVGRPLILFAGPDGRFEGKIAESTAEQTLEILPLAAEIAPFQRSIMPDALASSDPTTPVLLPLDPG